MILSQEEFLTMAEEKKAVFRYTRPDIVKASKNATSRTEAGIAAGLDPLAMVGQTSTGWRTLLLRAALGINQTHGVNNGSQAMAQHAPAFRVPESGILRI